MTDLPPTNEVWGKVMFLHLTCLSFYGSVDVSGSMFSQGVGGVCLVSCSFYGGGVSVRRQK